MSDEFALLERNLELFEQKRVLIVGQVLDEKILKLAAQTSYCDVLVDNYAVYQRMAALFMQTANAGITQGFSYKQLRVFFAATEQFLQHAQRYDCMLLLLTKNKKYSQRLLSRLQQFLEPAAQILILGANNAGGKSASSLLKDTNSPYKIDSARKCTLFATNFQNHFAPHAQLPSISFEQQDILIKLQQDEALFSAGQLDKGTELLLQVLATQAIPSRCLDLGCGCGILGIYLKKRAAEHVSLCDVSATALALSHSNAELNQTEVSIFASDMLCNANQYDLIVVNPPFHQAVAQNKAPTLNMLAQSAQHLTAGGRLLLVGNRFLHYERVLAQYYKQVIILKATTTFSVIAASNA